MDSPIREFGSVANLIHGAFFTGLRIVRHIIGWLASLVMPTQEDLMQAGIHPGEMRE